MGLCVLSLIDIFCFIRHVTCLGFVPTVELFATTWHVSVEQAGRLYGVYGSNCSVSEGVCVSLLMVLDRFGRRMFSCT